MLYKENIMRKKKQRVSEVEQQPEARIFLYKRGRKRNVILSYEDGLQYLENATFNFSYAWLV